MTMLINETSPVQTKKHRAPKDIMIDDAVYETVEYFYPGQILPLGLRLKDIMNIMNYEQEEALTLWREMQAKYTDDTGRVLVPHFCDHMGVDELFIHLFIASLKADREARRQPSMPQIQEQHGSYMDKPTLTLPQIIEKFKKGITYSIETLRERARLWKIAYPFGEPQFKRLKPYRVFIYPDEIAAISRKTVRTAQKMLQEIRKEEKMRKNAAISIKKFCFFHPEFEEDEVRKALASMYGEDE